MADQKPSGSKRNQKQDSKKAPSDQNIDAENRESAKVAGLRYVSQNGQGLHRRRRGKGFVYVNSKGRLVHDRKTIERISSLVIPPAWDEVWICGEPLGHLQAVGKDERGRKQYRYHPDWRKVRDETKYERMIDFGKALPKIRRQVRRDMRKADLPREKVIATVVKLLEGTLIRIGNEEYARDNHSFGLTTMRNKHVEVVGAKVHFEFRGKSGIEHAVDLQDQRVAKIVKACQHLPGHELFQYVDEDGTRHSIASDDVNAYLHEIAGAEFTAKDFRTWAGTVLAATALREFEAARSSTQAKKNVVAAIASVAEKLGNTQAVCRKCYIHPVVISTYLAGSFVVAYTSGDRPPKKRLSPSALRPEEVGILALLRGKVNDPRAVTPGRMLPRRRPAA